MAKSPYALLILAIYSFTEAIFFPIPNEVLLIPFCIYAPKKIYKAAFLVSLFSVLGGIAMYLIGYMFFDSIGVHLIQYFSLQDQLASFSALYDKYDAFIVFLGGITPIPYKLVTLFSGFVKCDIVMFIFMCALSRFARFYLIAFLLKKYGEQAKEFIEKKLEYILIFICIVIFALVFLIGWISQ